MRTRSPRLWHSDDVAPKERIVLEDAHAFTTRHVDIGSQKLRVAIKRGELETPLVIFNGIGANLEILEPSRER